MQLWKPLPARADREYLSYLRQKSARATTDFSSDVLKSPRVLRYDAELQKVTHQLLPKRGWRQRS